MAREIGAGSVCALLQMRRGAGKDQALRLDLSLGADNPRCERASDNFRVPRHLLGIHYRSEERGFAHCTLPFFTG